MTEFKVRSIGQIFSDALNILRSNLVTFVIITAILVVPLTIIQAGFSHKMTSTAGDLGKQANKIEDLAGKFSKGEINAEEMKNIEKEFESKLNESKGMLANFGKMGIKMGFWGILSLLINFIGYSFLMLTFIFAISWIFTGESYTYSKAYSAALARFGSVIGTILLVTILVVIGTFLCFLPGLIAQFLFIFAVVACVIEKLSPGASLGRSYKLVTGTDSIGKIIGIFLLCVGLGIVFMLIQMPLAAIFPTWLISGIFKLFILPYFFIILMLLYFDIRIRSEAYTLEALKKDIG